MLSVVCLLWATLTGAIHLQFDASEGLDERERAALTAEISSLVRDITGDTPNGDRLTRIGIRARRVSWRIQVSLERRDGNLVLGREELDLTRDPRSWRAPLADALRRLLPEGRELATRKPPASAAPTWAAATPPPATGAVVSPATGAVVAPAPVLAVDPSPQVAPPPPVAEPPGRGIRIVPILAIAAGIGGTIAGVQFVSAASDAIDNTQVSLDPDVLEQQQRDVLENAVIGSVLLSAGVATAVTGLVLLISD